MITTGGCCDTVMVGDGDNIIDTGCGSDWVYAGDGDNVITTGGCCDMVAVGDGDSGLAEHLCHDVRPRPHHSANGQGTLLPQSPKLPKTGRI